MQDKMILSKVIGLKESVCGVCVFVTNNRVQKSFEHTFDALTYLFYKIVTLSLNLRRKTVITYNSRMAGWILKV